MSNITVTVNANNSVLQSVPPVFTGLKMYHFIIKANPGYTFEGIDPTSADWLKYNVNSTVYHTFNNTQFVINSNDGETLNIDLMLSGMVTKSLLVVFYAKQIETPSVPIDTIENGTFSETAQLGISSIPVTLTANTGYYIGSSITYLFNYSDGTHSDSKIITTNESNDTNLTTTTVNLDTTWYDSTKTVTSISIKNAFSKITTPKTVAVTNQLKNATMSLNSSTMIVGKNYSITFTANDGYEFTKAGYIGGYSSAGEWQQLSMIGIGDGQTSTIPVVATDPTLTPIIFSIEATPKEPDTVELITNLTNATLNFTDKIPNGEQTLTFTASSGYVFSKNGTISVLSRDLAITDTTIQANGLNTLSMPFTVDSENDQTITIRLDAVKKVVEPTTATVNYQTDNITVTPKPATVNIGSTNSLQFIPVNGYRLNNDGSITQYTKDNTVISTTQITVENSLKESASYTVQSKVDHIVISLIAVNNKSIRLKKTLTNCHLNPDVETLTLGEQTLHLVAEHDCIFDKQGNFSYYNALGENETIDIVANNESTLDLVVNIPNGAQSASIELSATKQSVESSGGYANIYKTTPSEMNALSNEALWTISGTGDVEAINQNDFITNFYRLPLAIPTTELQGNVKFALGKYKSQTNTNQVIHDILTYDLGKITIPEKYKNAFDYQSTTCTLYAPFMPAITLQPKEVINKPFSIKYKIDMFTGNANINIYDINGAILYSGQNKISTDLPFLQVDTNKIGLRTQNTFNNDILTAYVIVNRQIPNELDTIYPTIEQGQLRNYNGNVVVKSIDLPDSIISSDKDKIISLLQKGVVIK